MLMYNLSTVLLVRPPAAFDIRRDKTVLALIRAGREQRTSDSVQEKMAQRGLFPPHTLILSIQRLISVTCQIPVQLNQRLILKNLLTHFHQQIMVFLAYNKKKEAMRFQKRN